jgi:hypothetical protein
LFSKFLTQGRRTTRDRTARNRRRGRRCSLLAVGAMAVILLGSCGARTESTGKRPLPSVTVPVPSSPSVPTTSPTTELVAQPAPQPGQSMQFVNEVDGWLIGGAHSVLATLDGGHSWHRVYDGPDQPRTVDFVGPSDGWVIADESESFDGPAVLLRTTDGGRDWTNLAEPTGAVLMTIDFVGADSGWALTMTGSLLATTDGGANWSTVTAPQAASLCVATDGRLWLGTTAGTVDNSTDNGAHWQVSLSWAAVPQVPEPKAPDTLGGDRRIAPWMSCSEADAWALYDWGEAAGSALYMAVATDDEGEHWTPLLGDYATGPLSTLPRVSNTPDADGAGAGGSGWFLGYCGPCGTGTVEIATASGTETPRLTPLPELEVYGDLYASFPDPTHGWVTGTDSAVVPGSGGYPLDVVATSDGGTTWHTIASLPAEP